MTREEAKKAAKVMLAYSEGKKIEIKPKFHNVKWFTPGDEVNIGFNFESCYYRIKKEGPVYRPFKDKEECWAEMQKHEPFGWVKVKYSGAYKMLTGMLDSETTKYKDLYGKVNFADGTPFGIKEG